MSVKKSMEMTCDKCGFVEVLDAEGKQPKWGMVRTHTLKESISGNIDLCSKCVHELEKFFDSIKSNNNGGSHYVQ